MLPKDLTYSLAPRVVVIADGPLAGLRAVQAVELSGGQTRGAVPVAQGLEALDTALDIDLVLLLLEDDSPGLDVLLDRLEHAARQSRYGSVIQLPLPLIDRVMARIEHDDVTVLCDPTRGELFASVSAALACRDVDPIVADRDAEPMRLRQLSEEVERIARTLAALSGSGEGLGVGLVRTLDADAGPVEPVAASTVRATIRARRMREQHFAAELFADPAWDMMLDLMAARLEGRQVAVSSLCIAAAVPATTALRWIKRLTDIGMFRRIADPRDGRRVFIELSEAAADALARYFATLGRSGLAAG